MDGVSHAFQVAVAALTVGANEFLNSNGHFGGGCRLNLCVSQSRVKSRVDLITLPLLSTTASIAL